MRSMVEGASGRIGDGRMSAVLDFPVKPEARPYLDAFQREIGHNAKLEPAWLADARRQAIARFAEIGFPTRRSESWRYLDLQALADRPLLPLDPLRGPEFEAAARAQLENLHLPASRLRLVIVNGLPRGSLSLIEPRQGVWFGPLSSAFAERLQLVPRVVNAASSDVSHPFAAINAAFFGEGYLLDVDPDATLEEPVQIIHIATGDNEASFHTRGLITLGEGARASILEVHAGDRRYWRNDVVAVSLDKGAELARSVVVEEAADAVHIAQLDARLSAGARLQSFALLLGGRTVRHEVNVALVDEGAHCEIDGAYIVAGNDEANIVTEIDHAAPGGQTRELIKGVAAGRGHGAFQGRIVVREHAQKTDAHQLSRNLIIGDRAAIDTKPELEIYADDVKCSHGASVGDLDEAALFYLRARGIPAEEARHMLIDAFLREAVETVDDLAIRTHLLRRLAARLAQLEGAG